MGGRRLGGEARPPRSVSRLYYEYGSLTNDLFVPFRLVKCSLLQFKSLIYFNEEINLIRTIMNI